MALRVRRREVIRTYREKTAGGITGGVIFVRSLGKTKHSIDGSEKEKYKMDISADGRSAKRYIPAG